MAGAVYSAFGYTGQKCSACSRIVVLDPVHDAFVERFVEATRSLNVGATDDPSTQVGPVIDAKAQARIKEYIEQGKQECKLAIACEAPSSGYFVNPTVFKDVSPQVTIAQEEIFGPVVCIAKFSGDDEGKKY